MRTYFDHNATTPVAEDVLNAMLPYLHEQFGNASSSHFEGQQARHAVESARAAVAEALDCDPQEIVFTSGGTESDNLAVLGLARRYGKPGDRILVSSIEHPAVREAARYLADIGFRVEWIPVTPSGVIDLDALDRMLSQPALLVAVMAANNETGVVQPVEIIGQQCAEHGVYFHVDAVQAFGKIPVNPVTWQCHTLAISGHKIYGPKGVGALYVRHTIDLTPLQFGGTHERGRRPGTENVAGIAGLGAAVKRMKRLLSEVTPGIREMRDYLEEQILAHFPDAVIHGKEAPRVPNTSLISFPGLEGETLMMRLDLEGFAVSTGSACASGRIEPSHVLEAMGVPKELARGTIRISLGMGNSKQDVDRFVETLTRILPALRSSGCSRSL